ncbi:MAG: hypothetical protein HYW27_02845 [Candidatus Aenigmarchaeota archaeon]|nr:hypothetical protein [Candidatus Aenigmarchaeota archaeon]
MKAALLLLAFSAIAVASEVNIGSVDIVNGTLVTMDIGATPYGGINGSIRLRLGSSEWYPDSVWLMPADTSISDFNYTGRTYRLPTNMNMTNNCISSIYESESGYAFKATVKEQGKFCILADGGSYRIVAEY